MANGKQLQSNTNPFTNVFWIEFSMMTHVLFIVDEIGEVWDWTCEGKILWQRWAHAVRIVRAKHIDETLKYQRSGKQMSDPSHHAQMVPLTGSQFAFGIESLITVFYFYSCSPLTHLQTSPSSIWKTLV